MADWKDGLGLHPIHCLFSVLGRLQDLLEREANATFDESNPRVPLWKLIIATEEGQTGSGKIKYHLLAVFHHVILDG